MCSALGKYYFSRESVKRSSVCILLLGSPMLLYFFLYTTTICLFMWEFSVCVCVSVCCQHTSNLLCRLAAKCFPSNNRNLLGNWGAEQISSQCRTSFKSPDIRIDSFSAWWKFSLSSPFLLEGMKKRNTSVLSLWKSPFFLLRYLQQAFFFSLGPIHACTLSVKSPRSGVPLNWDTRRSRLKHSQLKACISTRWKKNTRQPLMAWLNKFIFITYIYVYISYHSSWSVTVTM